MQITYQFHYKESESNQQFFATEHQIMSRHNATKLKSSEVSKSRETEIPGKGGPHAQISS